MSLVPVSSAGDVDTQMFAEVEIGADSSTPTVYATIVQASTVFYDTLATLDKVERLLAEGSLYGTPLVVLPEAFIGGYSHGSNFGVSIGNKIAKGKEEFKKYHASAIDVPDNLFEYFQFKSKSTYVPSFPFSN